MRTKKYFERRGFENVVIEFEFLKKILYVVIPFGVALTILLIVPAKWGENIDMTYQIPIIGVPVHDLFQLMSSFFNSKGYQAGPLQTVLFLIIYAVIFRMLLETVRKQFRF